MQNNGENVEALGTRTTCELQLGSPLALRFSCNHGLFTLRKFQIRRRDPTRERERERESARNVSVNSKLQHPSPGPLPGHLNFSRLACSNSLPSGQKNRSNAPPISTEIHPLKDKFRLQANTVHAFQRKRYAVMTPSNFF